MSRKKFSEKLRWMLELWEIDQSQLARDLGLTRQAVSRMVLGSSYPSPKTLERMAKRFGVKPKDLLPEREPRQRLVTCTCCGSRVRRFWTVR